MKTRCAFGIAVAGLLCGAAAAGAAIDSPDGSVVQAKWVPRKLDLVYMGFTSRYTCDGLIDQMRQILHQLGAGDDLKISSMGCTRSTGPEPMPGVSVTFSVLEPASAGGGGATVSARWEAANLDSDTRGRTGAGDCELLEQVKKQVLPLFATRNLEFTSDCFPHQVTLAGAHLKAEVLRPAQAAAAH